jgi:hypothetical protein
MGSSILFNYRQFGEQNTGLLGSIIGAIQFLAQFLMEFLRAFLGVPGILCE